MDFLLSCISLPVIYASALETITNHQSVPVWRVNGPRSGLKDNICRADMFVYGRLALMTRLKSEHLRAQSILWLNYQFSGSAYFVPHMKLRG